MQSGDNGQNIYARIYNSIWKCQISVVRKPKQGMQFAGVSLNFASTLSLLYLYCIMQNDIMFLLHAGEIPDVGTSIFCIAHKNVV